MKNISGIFFIIHQRYTSLAGLLLLLILLSLAMAEQLKVHPVGDSTTEAYELETAWRYWLYKKLEKNGFNNIDFVGSRKGTNKGTSFSDNDWDMDHDGHTSSQAKQVLNGGLQRGHKGNIKIWAPEFTPHIAIIYLGTNDIRGKRSTADIIKSFEGIIQVLREARKEVKIIMCQIPDWNYGKYGGNQAAVDALNKEIPSIKKLGTDISPVKIVDLHSDYTVSDHRDGIHPGKTGAPKIADRIYEAIVSWLKEDIPAGVVQNTLRKSDNTLSVKGLRLSIQNNAPSTIWIPAEPGTASNKVLGWSINGKVIKQ